MSPIRHLKAFLTVFPCCLLCAGCAMSSAGEVAGTALTLGIGGWVSGHQIRQVYYVGVFDPHGQVPPALYRITVFGEASAVNSVHFASGWVPAPLADSLETKFTIGADGKVAMEKGDDGASLTTGRGLWLFGPEGFRRAPRDHRLVILMGSDPSKFFDAVSEVIGEMDLARNWDKAGAAAQQRLAALRVIDRERTELAASSGQTGGGR